MATKQTAAQKPKTPDAVKAAAAKPPKAPRVHKVAAGQIEGPKGLNMPAPAEAPAVSDEQRQGERRQQQSNAMAQFVSQQMTTPAVHEPELTEEQKKAELLKEGIAKLAAELNIDPSVILAPTATTAKAAKQPRADKQVQNNVTRPGETTLCGKIWGMADKISHDQQGTPATIAQLRTSTELKEVNEATLKTQYARWRTYHGIKGRAAPAQQAAPAVEGKDDGIDAAFNRRATDPKPEAA